MVCFKTNKAVFSGLEDGINYAKYEDVLQKIDSKKHIGLLLADERKED